MGGGRGDTEEDERDEDNTEDRANHQSSRGPADWEECEPLGEQRVIVTVKESSAGVGSP